MQGLIIITNPVAVPNEANIINSLFDEGLELLHVRKPGIETGELKKFIEKINTEYLDRIALHQGHESARGFGINRLHFTETKRQEMQEEELMQLKEENKILSTSIHQVHEYNNLSRCFEYTFFGPVFNSISKPGYVSSVTKDFVFPILEGHPAVIGIGGIDVTNIMETKGMKFNGVALLGAIWQKPDQSIEIFKILQKEWNQPGQ